MSMIVDAINRIFLQGQESQKPFFIQPAGAPKHLQYMVTPCGKGTHAAVQEIAVPPESRNYKARSIAGFVDAVNKLRAGASAPGESAFVFVGHDSIVAFFGESTRRERVTLELTHHDTFNVLLGHEVSDVAIRALSQADFVWLLRSVFAGAHIPESVLPVIRELKFRSSSDAVGSVQHGKESMGKIIDASVAGATDADLIPETITFLTPVYDEAEPVTNKPCRVACALRIDMANGRFSLVPLPGEVERAERETIELLTAHLRNAIDKEVTVVGNVAANC